MEEKKPLHSKPGAFLMLSKDVINTSSKNNNVFQGMCNFHHDLDLLHEDTVFYRKRQSSYRKTQIFYRKVQNFYRKLCVLQETSCRRLRRPKCVSNEDLATEEWIECMHATDGTPEHCYYLAPPSSSQCNQDPCSSTTKQWVLVKKYLSKKNQAPRAIPHPRYASEALGSWSRSRNRQHAACTQGERTVTRPLAGIL